MQRLKSFRQVIATYQTEEESENEEEDVHPDDFEVCGPRNLPLLTWTELIKSSWTNDDYKRTVMACFIQAVYLLELDRQERREGDDALAPSWWKPFKYKVSELLVDPSDGSVFGAVFVWDVFAALSDFLIVRPRRAPKAVIVFRGTLLTSHTLMRDVTDDLRLLATDDLSGSCRFKKALDAVKREIEKYGSRKICMAGHSLGAGLAMQLGRALATEGIFLDAHLFNPPALSIPLSLRSLNQKFENFWEATKRAVSRKRKMMECPSPSEGKESAKKRQQRWVPHLYVNENDYICSNYSCGASVEGPMAHAAKLFLMSKGPTRFFEAHGIQQWWSLDAHLQKALGATGILQQ